MPAPRLCPTCQAEYFGAETFCVLCNTLLTTAKTPGASRRSAAAWPRLSQRTGQVLGVIAALLVILGLIYLVQQSTAFQIHVLFEEGNKLKPGDPVYIRGVHVGEVANVGFRGRDLTVTLSIHADSAQHLRRDSVFFIGTDNILTSSKCVAVLIVDPSSPPIQNGETIRGEDSWWHYYMQALRQRGKLEWDKVWDQVAAFFPK